MKRTTAVRHLVELSEVASEQARLGADDWPLASMWATGELLGPASELEVGEVVLVIEAPPEEMPWLALHPAGEWVGHVLRLGKRPLLWRYRPLVWPVWSVRDRRLARFWSTGEGIDDDAITALREVRPDGPPLVTTPSERELIDQLREERRVSAAHLRRVLEHYWDRDWRRDHKGYEESPEDHLWRAGQAVTEIDDALAALGVAD
ncbi:MAG: hypothetical protein S0880_01960 [Actinomycetota bacterium]|nr:hypothetical protein [Actinomycetota bacterium]